MQTIHKKFTIFTIAVSCFLAAPLALSAQESVPATVPVEAAPGVVSCFDYYRFGSVQTHLNPSVSTAVSGAPITFDGVISNENPYPIVDGVLYVKIFRTRGAVSDANGPDVVDARIVKSDIVIPSRSSVPVSFSWNVPSHAVSGDYQVATFFTTSRKFNLSGLSFTDDVIGNSVGFSIVGERQSFVSIDKTSVRVDETPYLFASFAPRVDKAKPVTVSALVRNSTNEEQRATMSWVVYQWDAQLRENVVQEESVTVTVPARSSAPVSVVVTDARYPVYLAEGTLTWKDTKSIIGVRFVREGADRLRINFPSVTEYPLRAGKTNVVFSCLHNSGFSDVVPGGRLEITLSDIQGNEIHSYTYSGEVTGAMMGVADAFMPKRDYDRFVLDARLYDANGFVDEAHLVYDCANGLGTCAANSETSETVFGDSLQNISESPAMQFGVVAIMGACALILFAVGRKLVRPSTINS